MKVGDLVYVAEPTPCCGNDKYLGLYFTLKTLRPAKNGITTCWTCMTVTPCGLTGGGEKHCFRAHRLRVVPPLKELEAIKKAEEQPA